MSFIKAQLGWIILTKNLDVIEPKIKARQPICKAQQSQGKLVAIDIDKTTVEP